MNNIFKRTLASTLVVASIASLTGCSTSIFKDDVASYPLVPALTESEVVDYYARAMSFDSVVTKNIDVAKTTYETKEVTNSDKISKLKGLLGKTEQLLNKMTYTYTAENALILPEETFHYIKSYLNDRAVSNGSIESINEALGYYFIDVKYDIKSRTVGSFTSLTPMLGLNGAFIHSAYYGTDSADSTYLNQAVDKLNTYYAANNITDKRANFDVASGTFTTSKNVGTTTPVDFSDSTAVDNGTGEDGAADGTAPVANTAISNSMSNLDNRAPTIDVEEFNRVVGSSLKQTAYMPDLSKVYNVPSPEGTFSGIGAYPCGGGGLTKFGFTRDQLQGTVTFRFVYKDDLDNPGTIKGVNVYPVFSEVTTGFSASSDNIVPDFLITEFEKLIERADRAVANCDMSALMSGKIYDDMGMAVLRGYENDYVNLLRQISTLRRVISRDMTDSAYLLEVESQRQEGPKGADVYGTYRDKSYVVVEQFGKEFVITDWITMTRQMQTEPDINPDSAVAKRLIALNLAGEVGSETKEAVTNMLSELYTASSYRVLNGPKKLETSNGTKTIDRGMYDCFNSDPSMLSSSKKEELNSRLRSMLVKYGTGVNANLSGTVTEWIGGADRQVEFTTEEVIRYQGRDDGIHMTCYYLVSSMNDIWVIDDIQIITSEEVSGQNLQDIVSRISG